MGTPTFGSIATLEAANTNYNDLCLMDSTHAIVVYADVDNSNAATACAMSISGTTITPGTPVVVDSSGTCTQCRVTVMDSTHAIMTWTPTSGASINNGRSVCLTLSGTTITVNSIVDYDTGTVINSGVTALSSSAAVVTYQDSASSDDGVAMVLSLSGTTITTNTPATFESTTIRGEGSKLITVDSTHVAYMYRDNTDTNTIYLIAMSISGTTITPGTRITLATGAGVAGVTAFGITALSSSVLLTAYSYDLLTYSRTVGLSGTTLTANTAYQLFSNSTSATSLVAISSTYVLMVRNRSNDGYALELAIDGTVITAGTQSSTFDGMTITNTSIESALVTGNNVVIGYVKSGGGNAAAVIATASGTPPVPPVPEPLPADAVFYSHLDGDMSDSRHDITLNGGIVLGANDGPFNNSIRLVGASSQYAAMADSPDWHLSTGDWTIRGWLYRSGVTAQGGILSTADTTIDGWVVFYGSANEIRLSSDASGTWGTDLVSDIIVPDQTWTHFEFCRSGNTLRYWQDGIYRVSLDVTGYNYKDSSLGATITRLFVNQSSNYFTGKLDGIELIKGTALHTTSANFTVPTSSATPIANTVFLWNASSDISTGAHDITTIDGQVIDSGGGQVNFNGAYTFDGSTKRIVVADSNDFNFGTGNFAFGTFVKPTNFTGGPMIYGIFEDGVNFMQYGLDPTGHGYLLVYYAGAQIIAMGPTTAAVSTGVWSHVALSRSGDTYRCYINGVGENLGTDASAMPDLAGSLHIGELGNNTLWFNGSIDEPLIIKGSDNGWTGATIDVPTGPYGPPTPQTGSDYIRIIGGNRALVPSSFLPPIIGENTTLIP